MQLDMFGASEQTAVNNTSPPVKTESGLWVAPDTLVFNDALHRGSLGDAIGTLNRLKLYSAIQVLLSSGFSISSSSNRGALMAGVQTQLLSAVKLKQTMFEIRDNEERSLAKSIDLDNNNKLNTNNNHYHTAKEGDKNEHISESINVSEGISTGNYQAGFDSSVDSRPVDDGLARASAIDVGGRQLPRTIENSNGQGTGYPVGSGQSESSEPSGNSAVAGNSGTSTSGIVSIPAALQELKKHLVERELAAEVGASPTIEVVDFTITDEDRIGMGSLVEKYQDNIRAIQIVRDLQKERRHASSEEKKDLVRYVGWGGLKGVFNPQNKKFAKQYAQVRELLSPEEHAAASKSQLNAFYTSPVVAKAMYSALETIGFAGGRVLEPSVGVGGFFGLMPDSMRDNSNLHGVELDKMTSKVAAALYPRAKIAQATGFQDYKVPNGYFDMVVGNPPFGSESITDNSGSAYSGWSIHNYFFAKSIDMLRPGGMMSMVVSHNFLDKLDPHVRNWISRRAELVTGARLPNTAFKENANTEVVTDILIFRRIDFENTLGESESPNWLQTVDVLVENPKTGDIELMSINKYFIDNPENVLGTHSAAGSMFKKNEYTVTATGELEEKLAMWVDGIPLKFRNSYQSVVRSAEQLITSSVPVPDFVKEGSYFVHVGKIFERLEDSLGEHQTIEWEAPNARAKERMVGMIELRSILRNQMHLERSETPEQEIDAHRAKMNISYDDFVRKFGYVNDPINRRVFLNDTESSLIQALEFDYEKMISPAKAEELGIDPRPSKSVKADIFSRRVLFPPIEIEVVETAKDALLHSLNLKGRVDMEYMKEVYGKDSSVIIHELGELLYVDPINGYVTTDEYLSGDVKTKLKEALNEVQTNPAFERNVAALNAVIPVDKMPSEIFASIGASWIPTDIYTSFAKEISGSAAGFSYVTATGQWLRQDEFKTDYVKNSTEFGTAKMGAIDILSKTMNSLGLEVKKRVTVDGVEKYVTDEEATEEVRQRADKIKQHWDSWAWSDNGRAERLTSIYNDKFNRIVERAYDGGHLTFPGMNSTMALLKHQKNGVWRGLQDRTMLLDQVVGAGKTYESVAMIMEMRRLGITKKPLIAVPNHLTLQWRSDFYRLYPGASVLAATPQDFEKENRERFFSKIVTGNWDAVIVGHSSLKKIAVPLEAEMKIITEQFDDIVDSIELLKRERGDRNVVRDLEKIKANLESKINKIKDKGGKKDNVVDFGDLGVDALVVDEFHLFKNLMFTTQMQRVAGLGNPAGSGAAFDMFTKIRYLKKTYGKKAPLIAATGTPVSNSLAEMFTMQKYMQYDELKAKGLHVFDAWAKQYGDVQTVYEVAPSGTGYRLSQRFAKFKNLPSLMGEYRRFADVITLKDLMEQEIALGKKFPVPKIEGGRPENVVAQRSKLQEQFFGIPAIEKNALGEIKFELMLEHPIKIVETKEGKFVMEQDFDGRTHQGQKFETRDEAEYATALAAITPLITVDPNSIVGQFENLRELNRKTKGKINALSLTGLANKAGLDFRIIDPSAPDFPDSKVNIAVKNMLNTAKKWEAERGVQLVFCDMSVPLSARTNLASKEKRLYVRDSGGGITHKKGTLHTVREREGYPYYCVKDGKTISIYDAISGVVMRDGLDSNHDAHEFVSNFLSRTDGTDMWLDMREKMPSIQPDEIDEYKNERQIDVDSDSADLEISSYDIEGASGTAGFSVYDDMKAKLIAAGIPEHEVEFIHDHDTPQEKELLFRRVNAGDVRFLFGSTSKMGAGTNVQKRLVALHHIDAPWRPSDLEQREGRIIRRGNELYERDPENFEVSINRYATSQTYDTRRWQLLEHKAAGVEQLRNYNGAIEIDDVSTEAANSADMKAAASGNPLILKETQLANAVKTLSLLERAHRDSEYNLHRRMKRFADDGLKFAPAELAELQSFKEARDNAPVLAEYQGKELLDKEALVAVMQKIADNLVRSEAPNVVTYKGLPFVFVKRRENENVTFKSPCALDDRILLPAFSPQGVCTRMENFVTDIDMKISHIEKRIVYSIGESEKFKSILGKPFKKAADLQSAVDEHGKVRRELMRSNSRSAVGPEDMPQFLDAVAKQKSLLRVNGLSLVLDKIEQETKAEEVNVQTVVVETIKEGHFTGSVVAINDGVIRQRINRVGYTVSHSSSNLSDAVKVGDMLSIRYVAGVGQVKNLSVSNEVDR